MEEVNVTWRFAWSLWWKMALITLGIHVIIGAIAFGIGALAMMPCPTGL